MLRYRALSRAVAVVAVSCSGLLTVPALSASAQVSLSSRAGLANYRVEAYQDPWDPASGYYSRSETHLLGALKLNEGNFIVDVTAGAAFCRLTSPNSCAPYTVTVPLSGTGRKYPGPNLPLTGSCRTSINPSDSGWLRCNVSVNGGTPSYVELSTNTSLDLSDIYSTCLVYSAPVPDISCEITLGSLLPLKPDYNGTYIQTQPR